MGVEGDLNGYVGELYRVLMGLYVGVKGTLWGV